MIISKINGGLGNQMFQYAIAKAISLKHKQSFKLDISAYETYSLHNGYRLNIFNIEENIACEEDIKNLIGKKSMANSILNRLGLQKNLYKEQERTIYDKGVFGNENIYLDGYWQNEKYFVDIREEILNDFATIKSNTKVVDKYLSGIMIQDSVSIHIRRGDYANHPEIGILDIGYYKNAVDYICNKVENPIFYIFSNDIRWCEENFNFIKNKIFINNTKTEIEDMILMKNCKHNIVANSSFSWWSAWLNINKDKIVIAPKEWLAINPYNYKWIPNHWMEL